MSLEELVTSPPDLPVVGGLARIRSSTGNVVISAPPGSGKTTLVPPAIAVGLAPEAPKVVVVQPRRVAARAAARRIASLARERLGDSVGFRVRGESVPGKSIEMVTPGVLLRMLQSDPELAGVGAVIVDEFHERDLDTDLATAFVLDVQESLRPDLRVLAMSATLSADQTAQLLSADVIDVPGDIHPVEITEKLGPLALGAVRSGAIVVQREFLDHVADVVRLATRETSGSALVFLPGVREISDVAARLAASPPVSSAGRALPVMQLHGRLPAKEQDRVLAGGEDRVILTTSVAESSLTVPGVRIVIDSGLAREPRYDAATGIGSLVTVHANRASMTQRAGRAGREAPGVAYRCLSFARAMQFGEPEIKIADVTDALLQSACWGAPNFDGLWLLDHPVRDSLESASATLTGLGAIDCAGNATDRGRLFARLPASPELARALIDGAELVGIRAAAETVAALALGGRAAGADLPAALRALRRGSAPASREFRREATRLERIAADVVTSPGHAPDLIDDAVAGVVALAHPRWIARRRGQSFVTVGGTGAGLPEGSPLEGEEWLAIGNLARGQGRSEAMIHAAAPIGQDEAMLAASAFLDERVEAEVVGGKVKAQRVRSLGAIELERTGVRADRETMREARLEELRKRGLSSLTWSASATLLRQRLVFLHEALGDPWPAMDDDALLARADEWLDLSAANPDLTSGLRNLLPWPEASRLDELAPERIATPISSAKVDYSSGRPRARMKLQEAFGWTDTPKLAGVPVTLELLSPAQRPLAVTSDLASFWAGPYQQVRAEMRGRYPKHPWPEDPLTAEPTRRTKRKS